MPLFELQWNTNGQGSRFVLEQAAVTLGRHSSNDIVVQELNISRFHAQLLVHQNQIVMRNLSDSIPIVVSHNTQTQHLGEGGQVTIQQGDSFGIGSTQFFVRVASNTRPIVVEPSLPTGDFHIQISWNMDQKAHQVTRPLPITIGRDDSQSVVLKHPQVSRLHASVEADNRGIWVRNHSPNGTFVNGKIITAPEPVQDGATFVVGSFQLRMVVVPVKKTRRVICDNCTNPMPLDLESCSYCGYNLALGYTRTTFE